jgi:peptide/nickel transport system permease protein
MKRFIRRVAFYLVAIWASISLDFLIPRLAPGDPAEALLVRLERSGPVSPSALKAFRAAFGVDTQDPLWLQYVHYIGNLLHGDLGISVINYPTPVADVIGQNLKWTLALSSIAVAISFVLGCTLGIVAAWRRGSALDTTLSPAMTFLSGIPYFWLALITLYFLGYVLGWFPFSDGYDLSLTPGFTPDFVGSVIYHGILPALTIVVSSIAGWMLTMRNSMITTLSEDYVLLAQAKGLSSRRVMLAYAARNAILPNVTNFALSLGFIVAGQLLTEIVFSYPGIGYSLLQAVQGEDFALMQGIFLIITLAVIAANFLADLVYTVLDPRVRQERSA